MYYFEEIRLVEHSKLLRQVKILQKMCQLHSYLKKNFFFTFFEILCEIDIQKTQDFLTQNDTYFVPRDHNPPNSPQIRPIENFFGILKQHVYAGNWSAKSREGLIRRIKKCVAEIDMTMVIKMFQNLKPKIIQANINGLDSLL